MNVLAHVLGDPVGDVERTAVLELDDDADDGLGSQLVESEPVAPDVVRCQLEAPVGSRIGRNARQNPHVSVSVVDRDDPWRYVITPAHIRIGRGGWERRR